MPELTIASSRAQELIERGDRPPAETELLQLAEKVYEQAVETWNYDVRQGSRIRNMVWACGNVYGAARVLAVMLGLPDDELIPVEIKQYAERAQV